MQDESIGRGDALKRIVATPVAALGAAAALTGTAEASESRRKQLRYQEKPGPGGRKCDNCRFFHAKYLSRRNYCTVLAGEVKPNAYCIGWARA